MMRKASYSIIRICCRLRRFFRDFMIIAIKLFGCGLFARIIISIAIAGRAVGQFDRVAVGSEEFLADNPLVAVIFPVNHGIIFPTERQVILLIKILFKGNTSRPVVFPLQCGIPIFQQHRLIAQEILNPYCPVLVVEFLPKLVVSGFTVENGLVLYDLYPVKNVQDWGFDAETGDGVILYEDGSAYIADIFTTAEELYQYAGNEGSK